MKLQNNFEFKQILGILGRKGTLCSLYRDGLYLLTGSQNLNFVVLTLSHYLEQKMPSFDKIYL